MLETAKLSINWPVRRMSHVVDQHLTNISAALRPHGLTAPMWRVLNGLSEGGPSTIGDIADHTAFERSYVSRLVARMADLGLAETIGDQTDCRRLHRSVCMARTARVTRHKGAWCLRHRQHRSQVQCAATAHIACDRMMRILTNLLLWRTQDSQIYSQSKPMGMQVQ
jgi:DNA-binding MarR family transcriptional regulator